MSAVSLHYKPVGICMRGLHKKQSEAYTEPEIIKRSFHLIALSIKQLIVMSIEFKILQGSFDVPDFAVRRALPSNPSLSRDENAKYLLSIVDQSL
jgi:hypothetical protein